MNIAPEALAGHTMVSVSSSWHEFAGERSVVPLHVWISVSEIGTLQLRSLSGLVITVEAVGNPIDMGEHGRIVVEPTAPPALSRRVGQRIERVSRLQQSPPGATVGMAIHFRDGSVAIADLGDELIVAEWPGADWERWGVSIEGAD